MPDMTGYLKVAPLPPWWQKIELKDYSISQLFEGGYNTIEKNTMEKDTIEKRHSAEIHSEDRQNREVHNGEKTQWRTDIMENRHNGEYTQWRTVRIEKRHSGTQT